MYISKIELKNIRCFENLIIDLEDKDGVKMWLTILGDNAVGKSTILRSIAMGLCDQSSAAALMKEIKGSLIRKNELNGFIRIYLNDDGEKFDVIANFRRETVDSPELIIQSSSRKISPWRDVFLCGYGVQIGDGGGESWESYNTLEAVYTLFNGGSDLQNTEAVMLRQPKVVRNWLSKLLQKILLLEEYEEIEYTTKGMFVNGPWGKFRVNELSDGYKRIIQLVVDFFGWQVLADRITNKDDVIKGILLIDEIETHLHPKWQRFFVDRLKKILPNVQIISTTHSPYVVLGTSDHEDTSILELDLVPDVINSVRYSNVNPNTYRGYTVDQMLTSSAFDMEIAQSGKTGDKIIRYRELFLLNQRTATQEAEYEKLKLEIDKELPEIGEQESDRELQREIKKMLEEINKEINDQTRKKT